MSDAFEEFGPYLVYERLGQGGMATVHRAEKRGVGIRRPVALKRLLPHVAAEPGLIKLFVDEARLASHLRHANVAQTYELGKVGDIFFIAMEYASGPTLAQIVRQCQHAATEIPPEITVSILSQVCEALDYAHNLCDESGRPLRIVHRDVSPANIIVTSDGIVKLIDFGIAKATTSSVKTQTGLIKGKFGYIAPEYITGQIDARVDLFAVGVVAHEMLAGRRLFEGKDDFETLHNIREMNPRPPSQWNPRVSPDLDDIVMTALQRDPADRWQSAGAMQVALANVARELGQVIGSQQLAGWIDVAFRDEPGAGSMPEIRDATDPDATGPRAPAPDSSLSIQVSRVSSEVLELTPPPEPLPFHVRLPSDSDETVPRERVAPGDFELFTPSPEIAPPRPILPPPAPVSLLPPGVPRPSRVQGAVVAPPPPAPAPLLPPGVPRPSRVQDAVAAPPPAPAPLLPPGVPRPSRVQDAVAAAPPPAPAPLLPPGVPRPSRVQDAVAAAPVVPRASLAQDAVAAAPVVPRASLAQDAVTAPPGSPPPSQPRSLEGIAAPPLRTSRPALPFMTPSSAPPRLSHTEIAVPPPPPISPRLSHTEIAVPPPPPIPPRSSHAIEASPPPEPVASPAGSVEGAATATDAESPATRPPTKQKVRSRAKPTQKTRPQPRSVAEPAAGPVADSGPVPRRRRAAEPAAGPVADSGPVSRRRRAAEPAASPAADSGPVSRRRRAAEPAASPAARPSPAPRPRRSVAWLILLMVALGAGAMAAAYYWPDLF